MKKDGKFAYNGLVKFSWEWKKVEEIFFSLINKMGKKVYVN